MGPSWGDEISEKALRALIVFLVVITIYISLRFEFRMAIPTLVALVHDILFTIGVYSVVGFEVTPATVIALLTILGFSIYDGIVVFDKVDENTKLVGSKEGLTYGGMVNLSLNQVLMRSLNTSITALIPVGSLLILGSFILGRHHAAGVRLGPAHRPVRRRLLVDLHRLAAPRRPEGARAPVPGHEGPGGRPPGVRGTGRSTEVGPAEGDRGVHRCCRVDEADDGLATADRPTPPQPPPGASTGTVIPPRPRKKTRKRR